jgi:hypothetical protein
MGHLWPAQTELGCQPQMGHRLGGAMATGRGSQFLGEPAARGGGGTVLERFKETGKPFLGGGEEKAH